MFHILLDQIISKHDSIGTFTFEQVEKLTLFINQNTIGEKGQKFRGGASPHSFFQGPFP